MVGMAVPALSRGGSFSSRLFQCARQVCGSGSSMPHSQGEFCEASRATSSSSPSSSGTGRDEFCRPADRRGIHTIVPRCGVNGAAVRDSSPPPTTAKLLSPRQQQSLVGTSRRQHQIRGIVNWASVVRGGAAEMSVDHNEDFYSMDTDWSSSYRIPPLRHRAVLVDAAGTLIIPTESMTKVYLRIGEKYGVRASEQEMLDRYRWAYAQPWGQRSLRYVDDGRHFWRQVVGYSTGCYDPNYFEEVYNYYATAEAWALVDPDAGRAFEAMRARGMKIGVVSNFDTRLRPILKELGCDHWFDAMAISAEIQAEKPNPVIFQHACAQLGVEPHEVVHVGDDRRNDVWGARDAGCHAWLWGSDIFSFKEVAELVGVDVDGIMSLHEKAAPLERAV